MGIDGSIRPDRTLDLRDQAIARLKQRRELSAHALVYLLVNGFLVAVWALASPGALFWPIFPMAGWGIGLVMHAWDVYRGDDFAEAEILREMERLQRR
jgi:hypothetical protein